LKSVSFAEIELEKGHF